MDITTLAPNHHAGYPSFSGMRGRRYAVLFELGGHRTGKLVADLTEVGPGDHVLDVGCGPGTALRAAVARGATGTGIDPSPEMLQVGRLLTRRRRRIDLRVGSAERLPVADGSATVAWSLASIHHWPDVVGGLAELHRALRPGGRLLALERRSPVGATGVASHGWTDAQVETFAAMTGDAGFVDLRVEHHRGFGRGEVVVVRADRP